MSVRTILVIVLFGLMGLLVAGEKSAGKIGGENGTKGEHYAAPFSYDDPEKEWEYDYPKDVKIEDIKWDKAIEESQKILSKIRARYELDGKGENEAGKLFMLTVNNMNAKTWDMIKYKTALKIVDPDWKIYRMIFGGSSVTAGHDNYYKQAYPNIVYESLGPMLAAVGIDLQVHNIAQTTNNCIPYDMCYESMGGKDSDFVNWEQSYNCGHDEAAFELTSRWSGWSKQKAIVYFSASGAWLPSNCPESKDKVPYSDHDWTPADAGIKEWKPTEKDLEAEKKTLDEYAVAHGSAVRFSRSWWSEKEYKGVSVLGFNVWETNPKVLYKGKAAAGATIGTPCEQMHFFTKEAAKFGQGKGARWHPSAGFHLLRGEFIAWLHALPMLDAMYMVQKELKKGAKPATLKDDYKAKLDELMPPMGSPKKCQIYHCEDKPVCYTNFYPHHNEELTLSGMIVGKNAWELIGSTPDPKFHGKFGFRDLKPFFLPDKNHVKEAPDLSLQVNVVKRSDIWLCGDNMNTAEFRLDVDGQKRMKKNGKFWDYTAPDDKSMKKYEAETKKNGGDCASITGLPKGKHVLNIRVTDVTKDMPKLKNVITW